MGPPASRTLRAATFWSGQHRQRLLMFGAATAGATTSALAEAALGSRKMEFGCHYAALTSKNSAVRPMFRYQATFPSATV